MGWTRQVFGPTCRQLDVYEFVKPVVASALSGFNGVVFAYGQTSAGKTFTMQVRLVGGPCTSQVGKRWPERWLLSTLKGRAASERRVALKPRVSLMGEIPSHLTADKVSCKQLPASRLVPHTSVKAESSYLRANVSPLVS